MADYQIIRDFTPGNALQVRRRVLNPAKPEPVTSATLIVMDPGSKQALFQREIKPHTSRIDPPPDEGCITDIGNKEPHVLAMFFNLFADETGVLRGSLPYTITVNGGSGATHLVEHGLVTTEPLLLLPPAPVQLPSPPPPAFPLPGPGHPDYVSDTSYTTYSDAVQTVGGRTEYIIDGFLDAILGDYRQLRVHDEHARRMGNNGLKFKLTYEYLNRYTTPEIFDGNNNLVDFASVDFNFREGIFSVSGDDGNQDYFCTYSFNFFPESILRMFVEMSVQELNFVGVSSGGGFITHYKTVDQTPETWDAIIALGAAAKAWRRLATNGVLWRNFLIFDGDVGEGVQIPGGQAAQAAAQEAATNYQQMFTELGTATKFEKFIAFPTEIYQIFTNTGFGKFGMNGYLGSGNSIAGGKFRGMTVNKTLGY